MKTCMFSCIKHAYFYVFSPFSAGMPCLLSPHDIIVEKGPLHQLGKGFCNFVIFWILFLLLHVVCNFFKQLPPALEP